MDYLIALLIAVVGLVAIWLMFTSVGSSSGPTVAPKAMASRALATPHAQHMKRAKKSTHTQGPKYSKSDDELDNLDDIVARELQRHPGMSVDSKHIQPNSLDERTQQQQQRVSRRNDNAESDDTGLTSKQLESERRNGFKIVGANKRNQSRKDVQNKKNSHNTNASSAADSEQDDMERKLKMFFKNSGKGGRLMESLNKLDNPAPSVTGGRVTVKRDLGHARSWHNEDRSH